MKVVVKVFVILAITAAVAVNIVKAAEFLKKKPDFIKPCHLDDANFDQCNIKNFEVIFHKWKDGIPGYKAPGSFDPLYVKRVLISENSKTAVDFNAELSNVTLTGGSNIIVNDARFNPKTLNSEFQLLMPKFFIDSNYKLKGRILNLALFGNGKCHLEIQNFQTTLHLKLSLRDESGYTFTDIDKVKLEIRDIGGLRTHFDNLYDGQKDLGESTNAVFNENWQDFYAVLHPAIIQTIETLLKDRLSKAYAYVPANYFIADISTAAEFYG